VLRFSLLGSGSSGNAILISGATSKVLIDAGLSFKQLKLRAEAVGESLEGLQAVFVTHEHGDHVRGAGVLGRKLGVPFFMTPGTRENLPQSVGEVPKIEEFDAGDTIQIDELAITSFSVSHDAVDPVGYVVESEDGKLGIASDLGHAPNLVRTRLANANGLILESNHCPKMLQKSSYPPQVQQRIRGKQGHLSNQDMCSLLSDLLHDALQVVVLVHLSEENNTREHAFEMASRVLDGHEAELFVARQDRPTRVFEIGP
jgi:phosphoribosyl 1,2-cyclic phosphodiesterase